MTEHKTLRHHARAHALHAQERLDALAKRPIEERLNVWGHQFLVTFAATTATFTLLFIAVTIGPAGIDLVEILRLTIVMGLVCALLGTWYIPFSPKFRWVLVSTLVVPVGLGVFIEYFVPKIQAGFVAPNVEEIFIPCLVTGVPVLLAYVGYKYSGVLTRWLFRALLIGTGALLCWLSFTTTVIQ